MVLEVIAVAIVVAVVGYVLYNHWAERYGDNHF
jgi:hypothetical protein